MSRRLWITSGVNKSMGCCKRWAVYVLSCSAMVFLAGCASTPRFSGKKEPRTNEHKPSAQAEQPNQQSSGKVLLTLEGIVSYYAHDFHGKQTSNGETFDMNALTAAHRTFPFGTTVRVTSFENNKTVVVRVNDRGPFIDGRIMDLSLGAAKEIDLIRTGTARARLEVLEWGNGQ
jgi:rare lipoprotein A